MLACFGKSKKKKYSSLPKQDRWIEEQTILFNVTDPNAAKHAKSRFVGCRELLVIRYVIAKIRGLLFVVWNLILNANIGR